MPSDRTSNQRVFRLVNDLPVVVRPVLPFARPVTGPAPVRRATERVLFDLVAFRSVFTFLAFVFAPLARTAAFRPAATFLLAAAFVFAFTFELAADRPSRARDCFALWVSSKRTSEPTMR